MKTKFIPIDYDSFDYEGKNHVKIFGKNETGESICLIDTCPIYFWLILKKGITNKLKQSLIQDIKKIYIQTKDRTSKIEKIEIEKKEFLGQSVEALKVYVTNYKDLKAVASEIDSPFIEKRRGYDLGFITHYIIEKKLNPLNWYEIKTEKIAEEDFDYIKESLDTKHKLKLIEKKKLNETKFEEKSLAFDIETDGFDAETKEILMISLYGKNFKKVITHKKTKTDKKYVEFVKNERELLQRFVQLVKEFSPDFLIGYNSDSFDLPFIKTRAKINKTLLPIGLDKSEIKINRGIRPVTKITGIVHIDLLRFIKTAYAQYMQSETLSLNDVANEFLGEKKMDFKFKQQNQITKSEWEKYYEYNLHDSRITHKLFEKFFPDLIEFTKVIKEPTFNISRNGLSKQIEGYILHNLERFNEIPEKKPNQREVGSRMQEAPSEGAFVYEPKPGLYENLAMFDFTSMHTSIIITHNISKGTLTDSKKNSFTSPKILIDGKETEFHFTKTPGFFPTLMKEIFEKRKQFKLEHKKNPNPITNARSNAFKVLSASAHGYVAFAGARYHSREASQSILAFVRKYNIETIEKIKSSGHNVVYGDTDSCAFTMEKSTKEDVEKILKKLNGELPGVMHLELEGFFKRGLWVTTRSGETGAKKKYAMIDHNGKVKIRGFETVRRDWCQLARVTQDKILRFILNEENEKKALEYLKRKIKQLKNREIPLEKLLIKTQLKKPISEYKSISPHVTAAKKLKASGEIVNVGTLIEYYIGNTNGLSKLVRDKAKLKTEKGEYDIKYYLEKQILPATENIFQIFNINIKEIIDGKKQEKLEKWF